MYEYKVISGSLTVKWSKGETVESVLENTLNTLQAEGWEFYSHGIVSEFASPGCGGLLAGKKSGLVQHQTFIFRRKKAQ